MIFRGYFHLYLYLIYLNYNIFGPNNFNYVYQLTNNSILNEILTRLVLLQ